MVGQNILDALADHRDRLRIIGVNSEAEAGGNFRCDRAYLAPPAAQATAYKDALAKVIHDESVDLVFPGRDADLVVLAQLRSERSDWAGRLLVGSLAAAQVLDDKVASFEFAQRKGLPFAPTVSTDARDARKAAAQMVEQFGFPLIAKPRHGNGSRGVFVLTHMNHLEHALQQPGIALQPMLDAPSGLEHDPNHGIPLFWGVPETRLCIVQGMINQHGVAGPGFGAMAHMVWGRVERMVPCTDPDLLQVAARFMAEMAQLGWRGSLNLELKRDPRYGLQAIEMNGRCGGATSTRRLLGFDEVALTINQWLGDAIIPLDGPPVGENYAVNKALADFPIPSKGLDTLQREGVWTRNSSSAQ